MRAWPVQDAKARFSEFLEACLAQGPQLVTKRGTEAAVLVSASGATTYEAEVSQGGKHHDVVFNADGSLAKK